MVVFLICLLAICKNESKEVKRTNLNDQRSKLTALKQKIINQKDNSDSKIIIKEISKNHSKKHTCMIVPGGALKGDINEDGLRMFYSDIL